MPDYQIRTSDDGEWRKIGGHELRRRLSKCSFNVDAVIADLNAGKLFRSGFGTFRRRPPKRKGSSTQKLF